MFYSPMAFMHLLAAMQWTQKRSWTIDVGLDVGWNQTFAEDVFLRRCDMTGMSVPVTYLYDGYREPGVRFTGEDLGTRLTPEHVRSCAAALREELKQQLVVVTFGDWLWKVEQEECVVAESE